jgi:hypothetical protein
MGDAGLGEKVRLLALTAALITALALTAIAGAGNSLRVKHKPWRIMTTQQKIIVLEKQIHKDKCIIRFWKNHRELASTNAPMPYKARIQTHWARVSLRIARKHLRQLMVTPRVTTTRYVSGGKGFPPHHALWLCLHSVEAGSWQDHNSGGNGHYGGLQMHYNWGYGIVGDAGNYSQTEQEWAAERGYRASGYSSSFIYGQWLEWEHGAGDKCIPLE